ncbi:MAG: hypothetical protein H6851_07515 [Geminicoccaceae bacterium]|nr:hypothetical protein [Geminicoccaceae bacterium]
MKRTPAISPMFTHAWVACPVKVSFKRPNARARRRLRRMIERLAKGVV